MSSGLLRLPCTLRCCIRNRVSSVRRASYCRSRSGPNRCLAEAAALSSVWPSAPSASCWSPRSLGSAGIAAAGSIKQSVCSSASANSVLVRGSNTTSPSLLSDALPDALLCLSGARDAASDSLSAAGADGQASRGLRADEAASDEAAAALSSLLRSCALTASRSSSSSGTEAISSSSRGDEAPNHSPAAQSSSDHSWVTSGRLRRALARARARAARPHSWLTTRRRLAAGFAGGGGKGADAARAGVCWRACRSAFARAASPTRRRASRAAAASARRRASLSARALVSKSACRWCASARRGAFRESSASSSSLHEAVALPASIRQDRTRKREWLAQHTSLRTRTADSTPDARRWSGQKRRRAASTRHGEGCDA